MALGWEASHATTAHARRWCRRVAGAVALAWLAGASFTGCGGPTNIVVTVTPRLALLLPGGQQQFSFRLVDNTTNEGVAWSTSFGGGSITPGGLYTAPMASGHYTVYASSVEDETAYGSAQVLVGPVVVTVSPGGASLLYGETQQFTAGVTGATLDHNVTWSASAGTIDTTGLFTAPQASGVVIVTGTSVADPTASGQAVVVVSDNRIRIDPAALVLAAQGRQTFTAWVTGLASDAVDWSASGGRIDSGGDYTAPATNGQFLVTATSQVEPTAFATALVVVSDVLLSVAPSGASLLAGQTQQFSATILGVADQSVTWSATDGSITAGGLFTAPNAPAGTAVTITATSVAIPTLSADATILVNDIGVRVQPPGAVLSPGQTQQFVVAVSGTANHAVTWSASGGSVDAGGVFTAPLAPGAYTVTATSQGDPTASASATVSVPAVFVSVSPGLATVPTGGTTSFVATVFGSANTAVTWSASSGAVSATGVYTAPATAGTYTVTATSVADPSRSATSSVIVTRAGGDLGLLINRGWRR